MTTSNQKKPKRWELYQKEWQIPELRTDEPVGLYPRQSTKKQTKNNRQSFEKQTQDAIKDLMKRGWERELIWVYDQDMARSGTLGIEEREGLNQMLADVRAGRIRTVRAVEVDRLFRDEDRIDSNVFIKVCKDADCLVLTDRAIYDFSIPRHVDYFRDEIERAWKYFESQILIRAHQHRDRAQSQGLYIGGPGRIGYIVDKNKTSPTYKKIIPYPRHAERVLELFQWLYDCGGIMGILVNRLDQLPYVFPLEEQWVKDQKAFCTNLEPALGTELDEEGNPKPIGYRISRDGLIRLLRNRTYLGEWKYNGEWIKNNHDPIVPQDLFDFAQECLDKMAAADVRNYHTPTPSVVHDILYAGPEGVKRHITARHDDQVYAIQEYRGMKKVTLGTIGMKEVEREFLSKFTERLRDIARFENYEQRLVGQEQKIKERRENLQDAIRELTEQIDGIFQTLKSPKLDDQQRDDFLEERGKLIRRREVLQKELNVQTPVQVYLKYKDLIVLMGKYWERYPFEDRQALVALLVKRVYLERLSPHFIQMTIVWKEFPSDIGIIWSSVGAPFHWTGEEDQKVREMYPTEEAATILEVLPKRSWEAIIWRASLLKVLRQGRHARVPRIDMSVEDVQVAKRYNIPLESLGRSLFTTWH